MDGKEPGRPTVREHLEAAAAQHDPEAIAELAAQPSLPHHGAHIWAYFRELHETRQSNGMSASRLTRQEIRLWQEDEGVELERWERQTVMRIDAAWVQSVNEEAARESKA